jgi:hypothetical protein
LNEDLGEVSLSKLRENSPMVLQTPTLLHNHYVSAGFYKAFQNSLSWIKTSEKKIVSRSPDLKNKIAGFILHKYFVGISSAVPYPYFSPLPTRVWKLAPTVLLSKTAPLPVFLKSLSETQQLLSRYVDKSYNLLKKPKPAQVPKS